MAAAGGIYASHMRNEGLGMLDATGKPICIGSRCWRLVQIWHHKASGPRAGRRRGAGRARAGSAREFVLGKVQAGASIRGLYPPDEQTRAECASGRAQLG
ncbi:MAG: hypothetical protein NVSMB2_07740 [Chloroflexota bacterium]